MKNKKKHDARDACRFSFHNSHRRRGSDNESANSDPAYASPPIPGDLDGNEVVDQTNCPY